MNARDFVALIFVTLSLILSVMTYSTSSKHADLTEVYSVLMKREMKLRELENEVEQMKEMLFRAEGTIRELAERPKTRRGRK